MVVRSRGECGKRLGPIAEYYPRLRRAVVAAAIIVPLGQTALRI
jgi:hypothetical protein